MLKRSLAIVALATAAAAWQVSAQPAPTTGPAATQPNSPLAVRSGTILKIDQHSITVRPAVRPNAEAGGDDAQEQTFTLDDQTVIRIAALAPADEQTNATQNRQRITLVPATWSDLKADQRVSIRADGDHATRITVQVAIPGRGARPATAPATNPAT